MPDVLPRIEDIGSFIWRVSGFNPRRYASSLEVIDMPLITVEQSIERNNTTSAARTSNGWPHSGNRGKENKRNQGMGKVTNMACYWWLGGYPVLFFLHRSRVHKKRGRV